MRQQLTVPALWLSRQACEHILQIHEGLMPGVQSSFSATSSPIHFIWQPQAQVVLSGS